MVKLEKIQPQLFPNLYRDFLHDDDPQSSEQDWRHVINYAWPKEFDHEGYALLDGDSVVGMMAMVFSERSIAGKTRKFCNLHTWWVREDHRGRSLALMRPVLKLKGYTITHFTPCDIVRAVTTKMGFQPLSSQLKILLPLGTKTNADLHPELTFEESEILSELDEADAKILSDHMPYRCGHCLIRQGNEKCYILYAHVTRHRFPYCHLHYVSNPEFFVRHQALVRNSLLRRHRARFNAVDGRLFQGQRLHRSFDFWAPSHAMFKSEELQPKQIDNLYSDVTMLRLTVMPDITHELKQVVRSWIGMQRQP